MWWWLRFLDSDLPEAERCIGIAVVEAESVAEAYTRSWYLGIHPGLEIDTYGDPVDATLLPLEADRERFLRLDEANEAMRRAAN